MTVGQGLFGADGHPEFFVLRGGAGLTPEVIYNVCDFKTSLFIYIYNVFDFKTSI